MLVGGIKLSWQLFSLFYTVLLVFIFVVCQSGHCEVYEQMQELMESSLTIGLANHMKLRSEVRIDVDIKERRKPALLRAIFYTFILGTHPRLFLFIFFRSPHLMVRMHVQMQVLVQATLVRFWVPPRPCRYWKAEAAHFFCEAVEFLDYIHHDSHFKAEALSSISSACIFLLSPPICLLVRFSQVFTTSSQVLAG